MRAAHFFLFSALTFFISCQNDEAQIDIVTEKTYANVNEELWQFYREFEEQAAIRGIEIDLNSFGTGVIEELNPDGVAGQCTYGTHVADVAIDQGFWSQTSSYFLREMVVFHELGHCYLSRGHEESIHPDGTCASIMRSGLENCRDNYTSITRAEYLDELFSAANP